MAPDGRSFVTAVSLKTLPCGFTTRAATGRSLRGKRGDSVFTPDGSKLLYRMVKEQPNEYAYYRDPGEVMVVDLKTGRAEPVAPGFRVLNFDISPDGREVVMEATGDGRTGAALAGVPRSQRACAPGPERGGWATAFRSFRRNSLPT